MPVLKGEEAGERRRRKRKGGVEEKRLTAVCVGTCYDSWNTSDAFKRRTARDREEEEEEEGFTRQKWGQDTQKALSQKCSLLGTSQQLKKV